MYILFIFHHTLCPWTLKRCLECFILSYPISVGIFCFEATLESNHCVSLLTAILFPAESHRRTEWTLHSILSSSGLWFHLPCSKPFLSSLVLPWANGWGDWSEKSLASTAFGNSDYCKWLPFHFLIPLNSVAYWLQKEM